MNTFKFLVRNEEEELRSLIDILPGESISYFTWKDPSKFSGIEVEIKLPLTLYEVRNLMKQISNGDLMRQTVALEEDYTGNRDYTL